MIQHDKKYGAGKPASPEYKLAAAEQVAEMAVIAARRVIEPKAPHPALAATSLIVAADKLLMRALELEPESITAARKVVSITLKLENPT